MIISTENELDTVKISVRDTGYGNGNKENELNHHELAISSSIAEGHGGNVTVESEPGKGTCFTLSLPVHRMEISCKSDINIIL